MRVRRQATVDRGVGEVWAALATGVPVVSKLWTRGQLSARTGQLPEPGALMDIVDGVRDDQAGTARIIAYRPPRHVSWAITEQAGPIGSVSGAYRLLGDQPCTIQLDLAAARRSVLGALVAPVLWLMLRRLAHELLTDLVAEVESREPIPVVDPQTAAASAEAEPDADDSVEERLAHGRVYAFRISRNVLAALEDGERSHSGEVHVSPMTRRAMSRALESLAKDADSRLISVSAAEAHELREHLGALARRSDERGGEALHRHAHAALVALDAVLATDYLTSR